MSSTVETAPRSGPSTSTFPKSSSPSCADRIAATRWPSKELVEDRSQGVQLATIQELARYWETDYDLARSRRG